MHGRFSKSLKYQFLFAHTFDKYFVWSNYFKTKLLKINSNYRNIGIFDKFKNVKIKKIFQKLKI